MVSKRIDHLLASKHQAPDALAKSLDATDLALLEDIAIRGEDGVNRHRAFALLVAADPRRAIDILVPLLRRETEPTLVRATAAAALGRVPNPVAEEALIEALNLPGDVLLTSRIASSLCRIATERSRDAFQALISYKLESVRTLGEFGIALIDHRTGHPRAERQQFEKITRLASEGSFSFVLTTPPAALIEDILPSLSRESYGVAIHESSIYAIDCDAYSLLCLNVELFRDGGHLLAQRPVVAGVLAQRSQEDGSFSTSRVILGGPRGDAEFYLVAFRSDGIRSHVGSGHVSKKGAEFELSNTPGDRRPVFVRGVLSTGDLRIEIGLYRRKTPHTRSPQLRRWFPAPPAEPNR